MGTGQIGDESTMRIAKARSIRANCHFRCSCLGDGDASNRNGKVRGGHELRGGGGGRAEKSVSGAVAVWAAPPLGPQHPASVLT